MRGHCISYRESGIWLQMMGMVLLARNAVSMHFYEAKRKACLGDSKTPTGKHASLYM